MNERKYLPTMADLIDRLTICQLKEVFIPGHKEDYAKEIQDILHDLEHVYSLDPTFIRAVIVLAQMNTHIWYNEKNYREGKEGSDLELTHGLNGIRNTAKNVIAEVDVSINKRKDFKVDCLAEMYDNWRVSW